MLKKSIMLPVLAVIAGAAASAFTTVNSSYNANSGDPSYYWFIPNSSGETYDGLTTVSDESMIRGCDPAGSKICANGYTQQQLVDPNNPEAGHQNVAPTQPLTKQ